MKLSKVIIFRDNFAFKLSKRVFKGISLLNNILRLKKKDHLNAFYQRDNKASRYETGWEPSKLNFKYNPLINSGDKK